MSGSSIVIFATKSRLQPNDPLFVLDDYHLLTQSHLRSGLATLLRTMGIPSEGHGFHTFRRSAATIAYDANASLTAIKSHGLWSSNTIWCYVSDNTSQALQVLLTFQRLVNMSCEYYLVINACWGLGSFCV